MITKDELVLIFEQLLQTSTTTNVWQPVKRIDMMLISPLTYEQWLKQCSP